MPEAEALDALIDERRAATTDVVLLEVLAGTTDEMHADRLRRFLAGAAHLRQESPIDAEMAAGLYRACRRGGEAPRSLNDCLVAAVALRNGVPVLHRDRDFAVLAQHTDLRTVPVG
ncbi:PIN domain-containing protein [Geodermatophilus sp. DF01_2]|uniref:type II toxin-antitoxin system VapC family toxin n=1 Tax=Geodermatophilus sp. DF01-2 TaxID=2559610 RepID=UPI0014318B6B|nr:PIN domain-containing protein [Geodermatophilus sp. DF01_2]